MKRKLKNGTIKEININRNQLQDLLSAYSSIQKAIMNLSDNGEHLFSTENLIGELGEILVCDTLSLTQEIASNKSYDATDEDNKKYQIKSRWLGNLSSLNKDEYKMSFGPIDLDSLNEIDYIVTIYFKPDLSVGFCYLLDVDAYKLYSINKKTNKGTEGRLLYPNHKLRALLDNSDYDITKMFK